MVQMSSKKGRQSVGRIYLGGANHTGTFSTACSSLWLKQDPQNQKEVH